MSSSQSPAMLLEVANLRVNHGSVEALRGVSVQVAGHEAVAIIGSNGAGKTTLLRTISGAKRPSAGTIQLDGTPIVGLRPDQILRLGVSHILEGRQVFPSLSVEENLILGATVRRDSSWRADIQTFYEYFPILYERRHSRGSELSGGQQQMLALARGLMSRPRLLLMDEPSMGLSPVLVDTVGDLIAWARDTFKLAVLIVEQNTDLATRIAERGYLMVRGVITSAGEMSSLTQTEVLRQAYLGHSDAGAPTTLLGGDS
jgi:branched-chain amino acid transport system ATP-binding protein